MPRPTGDFLRFQKYIFYVLFTTRFPFMTDHTPKALIYLWECVSWISVFLPLHMTICIAKTVYDRFDMETITTVGMDGVWFFFSFLGMVHYKQRTNDIVLLMNTIEETFKWRSAKGKTYVTMDKAFRIGKYISIFWQISPASVILASVVLPLFRRPVILPALSWYPIDRDNSYQFALGYFLQSWAKMVMVSSFASGSSFNISFSLMCCAQFNILRCGLKNLIYTSGLYRRFPDILNNTTESMEHPGEYAFARELEEALPSEPRFSKRQADLNNSNLSPEEVKSFQQAIRACVQHHLEIVHICGMMEEFLNRFAFLRLAEITLQICFLAFMYAKAHGTTELILICMTFFELFLLTYPAEYVQFQSKAVGESVMLGPWYLVLKHFRNDFIIIMAYSMRPIVFTAGKFLRLNTERFRLVITTAFSYYTLLSSFDSV